MKRAALFLVLAGCTSRAQLQASAPEALAFHSAGHVQISNQAEDAEKRGFADFNGDGLTDMIEINDTVWWGQKWVGRIFEGKKNQDGLLTFVDPYEVSLPISEDWFTEQTKFDTADVNGDGFSDVVIAQLTDDQYTIKVALNQHDGKTFRLVEKVTYQDRALGTHLFQVVDDIQSDEDKSLSDYFKMDWADADGDRKDDLFLLWETTIHTLSVEVWFSKGSSDLTSEVRFGGKASYLLTDFLYNRSIKEVDTEDVNGDHRADFWIYTPSIGDGIQIAIALNEKDRFVQRKDFVGKEIELDVIGFEKRDSFDINLDGCADYTHIGTLWSDCYVSYLLSPCESKK